MSTETATINIGPSTIATPAETNGPAFALSSADWLAIQLYVTNALALPTTTAAFKTSLGTGAPADLSDFTQLITAYATINTHVTAWQSTTFPATVALASDVYNYALQAPIYYNPILPLANILTTDPTNASALAELTAILGVLITSAQGYSTKATAVATQIQTFADQTLADKIALSGTDGTGGLKKYYSDKYGATSADVVAINKDLVAQNLVLTAANAEYNHDVVVAATTPTYAWIWPFGTIAAGVVAGIYGDKAVKALARAKAAQDQINALTAELAADALLMTAINTTEAGLTNILIPLNAALPVIQKIQGVWGAIANDLTSLVALIKTNIQEALPIIMNLGVTAAINAWTAVGAEANAYRVNAYVTVQPAASS